MYDLPVLVAQAVQGDANPSIIGPVLGGLINAGGMGIISAALLWLHRESLSTFRTELKEARETFSKEAATERAQCNEQFRRTLEVAERNHEATMAAIAQVSRAIDLQVASRNSREGR